MLLVKIGQGDVNVKSKGDAHEKIADHIFGAFGWLWD
jgi:hypothetical protein